MAEVAGLNLYAYVGNDPFNLIDPFGDKDKLEKGMEVVANFLGGISDGATFGFTKWARKKIWGPCWDPVDYNSYTYYGGYAVGVVAGSYATGGVINKGAAWVAGRTAATATVAAGAGAGEATAAVEGAASAGSATVRLTAAESAQLRAATQALMAADKAAKTAKLLEQARRYYYWQLQLHRACGLNATHPAVLNEVWKAALRYVGLL